MLFQKLINTIKHKLACHNRQRYICIFSFITLLLTAGVANAAVSPTVPQPELILGLSSSHQHAKALASQNLLQKLAAGIQPTCGAKQPAYQKQIKQLTQDKVALYTLLKQMRPFMYYVQQQIQQHQLPPQLGLLPVVESGFDAHAKSNVGASGLWQLMPRTATSTAHLKIDWWHDERRNIATATHGALNYLQRLQRHFHNWPLTLAAYNDGITNVDRAVRYNRTHGIKADFWHLKLPHETKNYVRKYLALGYVLHHYQTYGIKLPYIANHARFIAVSIQNQVNLKTLAKLADSNYTTIKALNPGLKHFVSSPEGTPMTVFIPRQNFTVFKHNYLLSKQQAQRSWLQYQTQNRTTVQQLAADYHCPLAELLAGNPQLKHMQAHTIAAGTNLLIPVTLHQNMQANIDSAELQAALSQPLQFNKQSEPSSDYITINSSSIDTLDSIADQYGVSVQQLRQWNHLSPHMRLNDQQSLKVMLPTAQQPSSSSMLVQS